MPEKFESGIPPQEKGEKLQVPEVSEQLSFLKVWQYGELTPEQQKNIEQIFKTSFERLPESEQKAISLELQVVAIEIAGLDKQNEGVQIIRQREISDRVRDILERSGTITSVKEGGIDRVKNRISEIAASTVSYLAEYEKYARSVMGKTEDVKQNAEYLLAIISGIRQELERLQLADVSSAKSQDELQKERKSRYPVLTSVGSLGNELDKTIDWEGIIGFSTLNKLTKKFHSAKKYLEEAVLETEAE